MSPYEFIKGLEYKFTAGGDYYPISGNYYRPSYIPCAAINITTICQPPKRRTT